ncbi:MAG: NAD(P)/FAD-dependent oxidoreductase, partial [Planctomycetes bacterium]|nr:NAD(P)/FAD-dependent oxidoreductase [Planctomycetota bacterium]
MLAEHVDVLVVGAGISGIGAGYHLQTECPGRSYAILERRDSIGGTWDLFRYPGVRSDSDMYTLGFSFRPWTEPKAIAEGPAILDYVRETAAEYGIDRKIRFGHHVKQAAWSTQKARWTVETERAGETCLFTCNFLFMCSGYYDYDQGYTPEFEGRERFAGRIIHPQKWTSDVDYESKRVVVIGSGATAVTLVPELAKKAAHVTMLQRTPTYMLSAPLEDRFANFLQRHLPSKAAYLITRWKYVLLGLLFFKYCRRFPERAKRLLLGSVRRELGDAYDVERHFNPPYGPWMQRMCLVAGGDLFESLRNGSVSMVTDRIDCFTEKGLRLESGDELEADVVVTATGLNLQLNGGLEIKVDGRSVDPSRCMSYKGMMFSDVPNMAMSMGYTNASWTLKCDLTCGYVCRLLNHMESRGYEQCCPRVRDPELEEEPMLDFSSGYIR